MPLQKKSEKGIVYVALHIDNNFRRHQIYC